MADTLRETITVHPTDEPGVFTAPPFFARARAGNAAPIAFGGLALSQAVSAAFLTLPPPTSAPGTDYHLFSVQGSYLGPASTEVPTSFTVQDVRTTRTMITRVVIASQMIPAKASSSSPSSSPNLVNRKVLICICDFHRPEPAFLSYTAPVLHPGTYPNPNTTTTIEENFNTMPFPPKMLEVFKTQFGLPRRMYEYRPVMTSTGAQNSLGFINVETTQKDMDITRRTSTNWIRAREKLDTYADRCAALAFIMDTTLSFLPLALNNIPLTAAKAASSLEWSLRFFSPPPVAIESDWLLHEQHTQHADEGRSFSEGRMYNEQGVELARMSQMSILRGPEGAPAFVSEKSKAKL